MVDEPKKKKVKMNIKDIDQKSSQDLITPSPDVCKTPSPAGPVPIPYPNIAKSSDTSKGTKTVKIDGKEVMTKDSSYYKKSTGDEPSTREDVDNIIGNIIKVMKVKKLSVPLWIWGVATVVVLLTIWILTSNAISPAPHYEPME